MRLPAVVVSVVLAFIVSCTKAPGLPATAAETPTAPSAPAAGAEMRATNEDRACTADAECVLATEDCCGCSSLGKQIGVRVDRIAVLTDRRAPICAATLCAAAMSEDPTCAATKAGCRAGVCVADVATAPAAPAGVKTEAIPPG